MTAKQFTLTNTGTRGLIIQSVTFNNPVGIGHTANLSNLGGSSAEIGNALLSYNFDSRTVQTFTVDYYDAGAGAGKYVGNIVIGGSNGTSQTIASAILITNPPTTTTTSTSTSTTSTSTTTTTLAPTTTTTTTAAPGTTTTTTAAPGTTTTTTLAPGLTTTTTTSAPTSTTTTTSAPTSTTTTTLAPGLTTTTTTAAPTTTTTTAAPTTTTTTAAPTSTTTTTAAPAAFGWVPSGQFFIQGGNPRGQASVGTIRFETDGTITKTLTGNQVVFSGPSLYAANSGSNYSIRARVTGDASEDGGTWSIFGNQRGILPVGTWTAWYPLSSLREISGSIPSKTSGPPTISEFNVDIEIKRDIDSVTITNTAYFEIYETGGPLADPGFGGYYIYTKSTPGVASLTLRLDDDGGWRIIQASTGPFPDVSGALTRWSPQITGNWYSPNTPGIGSGYLYRLTVDGIQTNGAGTVTPDVLGPGSWLPFTGAAAGSVAISNTGVTDEAVGQFTVEIAVNNGGSPGTIVSTTTFTYNGSRGA